MKKRNPGFDQTIALLFTVLVSASWAHVAHAVTPEEIAQAKKAEEDRFIADYKARLGIGPATVQSKLESKLAQAAQEAFKKHDTEESKGELGAITQMPGGLLRLTAEYLSNHGERCVLVGSQTAKDARRGEVNFYLGKFIEIPGVTQEQVTRLQQALDARGKGEKTSITPLPAFRVAPHKTPVGLYHAVYGHWPDLTQVPVLAGDYEIAARAEIIQRWEANPWEPLTYTTTQEDMDLAWRVSAITGRKIYVTQDPKNEYLIRGLVKGEITASAYSFGEDASQVRNHAWILSNSGAQVHAVNEHPVGATANSFGLYLLGNVSLRSSDANGRIRGGGIFDNEWLAGSSNSEGGYADKRDVDVGSLLAEDPSP